MRSPEVASGRATQQRGHRRALVDERPQIGAERVARTANSSTLTQPRVKSLNATG